MKIIHLSQSTHPLASNNFSTSTYVLKLLFLNLKVHNDILQLSKSLVVIISISLLVLYVLWDLFEYIPQNSS